MSTEQIRHAMDGYNRVILKICITFAIVVFVVVAGFSAVLIYNTHKTYDYDYPDISNTSVSGDENVIGGEK